MKEFIPPLLDIYLIRAMQLNVLKKEIISLSIPILGNIPMQCTLLHPLQCLDKSRTSFLTLIHRAVK